MNLNTVGMSFFCIAFFFRLAAATAAVMARAAWPLPIVSARAREGRAPPALFQSALAGGVYTSSAGTWKKEQKRGKNGKASKFVDMINSLIVRVNSLINSPYVRRSYT